MNSYYLTELESQLLNNLFDKKEHGDIYRLGKLFSTESSNYFYDTGTGKVLLLDDEIYKIMDCLFDRNNSETYESFINQSVSISSKSIQEFIQVVMEENLLQAPKLNKLYTYNHYENLENMVDNNLSQLILELTGKCNLRCGYCIYNDDYIYNRSFNNEDMSQTVAKKAIDYANEHSEKEVAITFYGGEPLMNFGLLKWCIDYSRKTIIGKELTFSLTTNLTLITERIAKYFAEVPGLRIVCSLDGPEEVQNSYRKYVNGKGTFSEAIRGLKHLVDAFSGTENSISINSVLAPPYNYTKIESINNFFENLSWLPKDTNISIGYAAEDSVPNKEQHIQELSNDSKYKTKQGSINPLWIWQKGQTEINEKIRNGSNSIYASAAEESLLKIHKRFIFDKPKDFYPFNGCCIPGSRRLYVDTKGDFYVCERVGLSPSIGNVYDGINLKELRKHYIEDFSNLSSEKCSDCWAIRLCSQCYVNCYTKDGFDKNAKDQKCRVQRHAAERELSFYHSVYEKTPYKLEYLNDIEVY
ncbi:radical SAM/SPASM domain-containing protein [Paenibacillus macerans]|uniref:Radical SAM additional 4Fe4S-binding SPASM domain protein n=1 Tax=Paenibacillus macerans TaxID=44252 RepID=A0A090Y964_PAEMA|nr:radical SAM protein [Paenibacillus macerans]KFM94994.1 radical SAM additional 4Fe4S-binding SPASM domain protein [Paenibacillus macerans]MCY7560418.1 radical SAM protein [Paenibacillus macerans]MEC0153421.1 radical SAM protein [Paenibacillus macerans]SUD26037.1 Ribosomal RNA large subunit methyltransferase N EC [Paenibacillus macerans]